MITLFIILILIFISIAIWQMIKIFDLTRALKGEEIDDGKIVNIFKKYNSFYAYAKINKIENFSLSFEMLRKYTYSNILAFGDLIHRIHPLAGQGFNMTIRDIKVISKIVNDKIS